MGSNLRERDAQPGFGLSPCLLLVQIICPLKRSMGQQSRIEIGGEEIFNHAKNSSPCFKVRQCTESFETWFSFKLSKNYSQLLSFQPSLWALMKWAEITGRMHALVQL